MATASSNSILALVDAIAQLSPAQRRSLQRRLYASGLFVPELLLTDQDRLHVAPALGEAYQPPRHPLPPTATGFVPPSVDRTQSTVVKATPATTPPTQAEPPHRPDGNYRSPVSGKVVVGAPSAPRATDPHLMPPLPGQAPEQPIGIIFDGGSKGNPGRGYGSYALRWPGEPQQVVRLQFGNHVTNNEAEYDTLITALEAVSKRLRDGGADLATARLEIRGDSLLVVNQVRGEWQCKEARLQLRRDRVRSLLKPFGDWHLTHHDRANSVEVLGH
ncbi:MAG: reverse transcriptase-like protein [Caldilineaceae bacterium]